MKETDMINEGDKVMFQNNPYFARFVDVENRTCYLSDNAATLVSFDEISLIE